MATVGPGAAGEGVGVTGKATPCIDGPKFIEFGTAEYRDVQSADLAAANGLQDKVDDARNLSRTTDEEKEEYKAACLALSTYINDRYPEMDPSRPQDVEEEHLALRAFYVRQVQAALRVSPGGAPRLVCAPRRAQAPDKPAPTVEPVKTAGPKEEEKQDADVKPVTLEEQTETLMNSLILDKKKQMLPENMMQAETALKALAKSKPDAATDEEYTMAASGATTPAAVVDGLMKKIEGAARLATGAAYEMPPLVAAEPPEVQALYNARVTRRENAGHRALMYASLSPGTWLSTLCENSPGFFADIASRKSLNWYQVFTRPSLTEIGKLRTALEYAEQSFIDGFSGAYPLLVAVNSAYTKWMSTYLGRTSFNVDMVQDHEGDLGIEYSRLAKAFHHAVLTGFTTPPPPKADFRLRTSSSKTVRDRDGEVAGGGGSAKRLKPDGTSLSSVTTLTTERTTRAKEEKKKSEAPNTQRARYHKDRSGAWQYPGAPKMHDGLPICYMCSPSRTGRPRYHHRASCDTRNRELDEQNRRKTSYRAGGGDGSGGGRTPRDEGRGRR